MNSTINDIRERHADQATLNKADLACEVMLRTRCTKVEANHFTNAVLESMTEILASGKGLEIRGFGVFKTKRCSPRTGRNPHTGEPVPVPAHVKVICKMSKLLCQIVNAANAKK